MSKPDDLPGRDVGAAPPMWSAIDFHADDLAQGRGVRVVPFGAAPVDLPPIVLLEDASASSTSGGWRSAMS